MSGNSDNSRIWTGADCLTAPLGTTAPTDLVTAFSATWKPLGLLGDDGMKEGREQSRDDKYAWGGILVRTTLSKQKRTLKVVALEDNPVTFGLTNPGSAIGTAVSGVTTRTIKIPTANVRAFAFQLVDGTAVSRRRIVPRGEIVDVGEITFGENDLQAVEYTIDIYPAADGTLYFDIGNEAAFAS